ncbi:MAG: hypothetical protein J5496_05790 [Lachnospiraceae bacterium]|nr:hypothetical protein [Lachnospiraceae bacterium]
MNLETVEYVKELDGNYLLLDTEEASPFVEKMLCYGRPRGILPFRVYQEEPRRCSYEISGRESLSARARLRALQAEEIREIVRAVYAACGELEDFLLRPGSLIAEPGMMYRGRDGWAFCVHPSQEEDIIEQMQRLSRFFLTKCDHQDPETAELAYSLFQLCHEANVTFAQIMELIGTDPSGEKGRSSARKKAPGRWFRRRG